MTTFGIGKLVIRGNGYDLFHSSITLPDQLKTKLRHAAETGEPYASGDRLYTLKDKIAIDLTKDKILR